MNTISKQEKKKMAALLVTPFLTVALVFSVREVITHYKTQDLIRWIGFQNDEWAKQALKAGANPNARTADGWSMVMWAVGNNGNTNIIKMLKDAGATTNPTEDLFVAALSGDHSGAKTALQHGANVNAVEKDGWTPLMWAACRTDSNIVKQLIEWHADLNWVSRDRKTATDVACNDFYGVELEGCGPGAPCEPPSACGEVQELLKDGLKSSKPQNQTFPPTYLYPLVRKQFGKNDEAGPGPSYPPKK